MKFVFHVATGALALAALAGAAQAQPADAIRVGSPVVCPTRALPVSGSASPCSYTMAPMYETLNRVSAKGDVTPMLSESWKNIDKTTWEVKIKKGVKFHNGEVMTAQGVADWFAFLGNPDSKKYVSAQNFQNQSRIVKTTAVSDDTIRIETSAPVSVVDRNLAAYWIVAPKFFAEQGIEALAQKGAGTGPYELVSWDGAEVKYTANANARNPAKIKNLSIREIKEAATRTGGVISGELDIAIGVPIDDLDRIKASGAKVDVVERTDTSALRLMATRDGPLKDKRVRQALNHAINRPALEKDLMKGIASAAGQCATPGSFGYDPNIKPYAYDPAKAKALLAEAGFANGFSVKADVIPGNFPADGETYQLAAQNLGAIGIKTDLEIITFGQWLQKWSPGPDAKTMGFNDIFQNGCMSFTAHPLDVFPNLSCRKLQPSHCDQNELKLMEAIEQEFDTEKQRKLVQQLLALNHENAAIINLNVIPDLTGLSKRVRNFVNVAQRYDYGDITFQ